MSASDALTAVEQEIADEVAAQPLISPPQPFQALTDQLKGNEAFLRKLPNVAARYAALRRVRGDGNCFFRAFIFSLLQQVTASRLANTPHGQLEADRLVSLFRDSLEFLLSVGYERVSVEIFYDMVMELMDELPKSMEDLEAIFADAGESTHVVWYSRVLCAAYLKHNADRFLPFVLDSCSSVEEFCAKNVEPMDRECEEVQVTALAQYFGVPVTIEYLDASAEADATTHVYEPLAESAPTTLHVYMLYRPSHYDLLVPKRTVPDPTLLAKVLSYYASQTK